MDVIVKRPDRSDQGELLKSRKLRPPRADSQYDFRRIYQPADVFIGISILIVLVRGIDHLTIPPDWQYREIHHHDRRGASYPGGVRR